MTLLNEGSDEQGVGRIREGWGKARKVCFVRERKDVHFLEWCMDEQVSFPSSGREMKERKTGKIAVYPRVYQCPLLPIISRKGANDL